MKPEYKRIFDQVDTELKEEFLLKIKNWKEEVKIKLRKFYDCMVIKHMKLYHLNRSDIEFAHYSLI